VKFVRRVSGRTFKSLQVRNFRLYFVGQLISISGTWMQSFAQGFLVVLTLHASAVDLGVTIALPFVPMLLLGPLGGAVVDRSDKRFILYFTQSSAAVLALTLGILVSTHHVSLPAIWTLASLLGVVNLFDNPARQSFVQEMVGKDLLPNAVSINSALINMGRVVGPAIGGALLFVGIATCFYVNAASFAALLAALVMMRAEEITRIRTVSRAKGQVREGLRYAFENREIREVLTCVTIVGLFAFNFTVTLPLLAIRVLHGTSSDYALLTCSMGLGGLLGGLYVAHRSRPTRKLLGLLAAAFGLLMALVAAAPSIWLACIAIVPMGAASLAFVSTANATLQMRSDERMRGRVMSLYAMGFLGTTPIGALVVALVAAASNARVAIAVGALATVSASLILLGAARARATAPLGDAAPATPA
jgi:MFS family permease